MRHGDRFEAKVAEVGSKLLSLPPVLLMSYVAADPKPDILEIAVMLAPCHTPQAVNSSVMCS